jgi:hypothetical protein
MLKTLLYGSIASLGVIVALFSPLYGAVAVIESYMLHPTIYSPELKTVRLQLVTALAFLVGYVVHAPRGLPRVDDEAKLFRIMCLYTGLALASSVWAVRYPDIAFSFAFGLAKTVFVTLLLVNVAKSPRDVSTLLWAILIGVSHAAFMHTIGAKLGYLPEDLHRDEHGALPDFQGSIMVMFFPSFLLVGLFCKSWWKRSFCLLSLPLIADSIVNTYQRTFVVAAAVQGLYLLINAPGRAKVKIAAVMAAGAVTAAALFMPEDYWQRLQTIKTYKSEASAASRFTIADASMRMLKDYPFGVGFRNYQYVSRNYLPGDSLTFDPKTGERVRAAHNTWFAVACDTGILGIFLFCATFFGTWRLLRKTRLISRADPYDELALITFGLETGLIGWAVAGLFQTLSEDDPVFWTVALAVLLYRARHMSLSGGATNVPAAPILPDLQHVACSA